LIGWDGLELTGTAIKDMSNRHTALIALLKELPKEHYNTLRALMLHLNRVTAASGNNLMTSQNLGVVFGREYTPIIRRVHQLIKQPP
jgi:hypothetical protein